MRFLLSSFYNDFLFSNYFLLDRLWLLFMLLFNMLNLFLLVYFFRLFLLLAVFLLFNRVFEGVGFLHNDNFILLSFRLLIGVRIIIILESLLLFISYFLLNRSRRLEPTIVLLRSSPHRVAIRLELIMMMRDLLLFRFLLLNLRSRLFSLDRNFFFNSLFLLLNDWLRCGFSWGLDNLHFLLNFDNRLLGFSGLSSEVGLIRVTTCSLSLLSSVDHSYLGLRLSLSFGILGILVPARGSVYLRIEGILLQEFIISLSLFKSRHVLSSSKSEGLILLSNQLTFPFINEDVIAESHPSIG